MRPLCKEDVKIPANAIVGDLKPDTEVVELSRLKEAVQGLKVDSEKCLNDAQHGNFMILLDHWFGGVLK